MKINYRNAFCRIVNKRTILQVYGNTSNDTAVETCGTEIRLTLLEIRKKKVFRTYFLPRLESKNVNKYIFSYIIHKILKYFFIDK